MSSIIQVLFITRYLSYSYEKKTSNNNEQFKNQLLISLEKPTVFVMDNSGHHEGQVDHYI